jgi:hypothetical protein
MLFHIQFPFTDLRSFLPNETARITVPSWPAPIVREEFVRSFGVVRQRWNGGLSGWIGENTYCDARRALQFRPGVLGPRTESIPHEADEMSLKIAFRRLFFDGYAVGKIELGLKPRALPATRVPIENLIARVLSVRARVRVLLNGGCEEHPLYDIGRQLVLLYAYATSRGLSPDVRPGADHLLSEAPMLYIELNAIEASKVAIPEFARRVPFQPGSSFAISFWRYLLHGRTLSIWCSVVNAPELDLEARSIRMFLLRLNAEHQAFKRVLKAIGTGIIVTAKGSDISDALQYYINEATRRIGKCEVKTQAYSEELNRLAFSLFDAAAPGERDGLMERLRLLQMRGNIQRKVEAYTSKSATQVTIYTGVLDMSSGDTINVTNSTNVNIKATLTNVRQTIGTMAADDTQKQELQQLIDRLSEQLSAVPADKAKDAEKVAKRASQLVDAAAEEEPDKSIVQTIGSGLKQAAEFLKDSAPAVMTIAGQIIKLIGNMHGIPI